MNSDDRGNKGIVPTRSNSVLSIQVANLQEDIEKLKEANHCLSAYETILNMYQTKNAQFANEKLQMQQTIMELNETIKMLEQEKKRQQTQIMDLQYNNISLMTRIESEATGDALKRELDELKKDYSLLQEKQKKEEDQKIKLMNQYLEMDYAISKKEEEIEELQHINTKLENEVKTSMLEMQQLREEKESVEKQLQALQEELQQETDTRGAEKEQFESKYSWLLSEVKMFKANFENEHAETENLKQHMDVVMKENLLLHQQAIVTKDLNTQMLAEIGSWKQQFHNIMQTHGEKLIWDWLEQLPQLGVDTSTDKWLPQKKKRPKRLPGPGIRTTPSRSQALQEGQRVVEIATAISSGGYEPATESEGKEEVNSDSYHVSLSSRSSDVFIPQVTPHTPDDLI
ncbi:hypothetical protein NDU88_004447 [Pleurodeles waltl]|uniref:Cancer-associated gene protein 1 N-terminal domain-containing protein n=1 Tax=Pleurodeles waltl TaxID=8319 RepID=A0AAV7VIU3_PLEWA|nr:hypothetical protein NDU88_004447 [Pleurodeles waltl]